MVEGPEQGNVALAVAALALVALWIVLRAVRAFTVGLIVPPLARLYAARSRLSGLAPFAWFKERFPRSWRFVARRFGTERFTGLPLTLLVAAALYLAFLFGGLTEELLESREVVRIDETIEGWFAAWRLPAIVHVFRWITEFGALPALSAIALVATGFMTAHGPRRYILPVWITIVGSQLTTWAGKFLIYRPRPDFLLDVTAASPSFPSAHASSAVAVWGIIAYAISRDLPPLARFDLAYWTAVLALLIGASRVVLSVHFPSDVAAGILLGVFWLLVGIAVAEYHRPRLRLPPAELEAS